MSSSDLAVIRAVKRMAAGAAAAALFLALATIRPAHSAETHTYDAIGRLTDVSYASGGSIHYTYDPNSNLLSIVANAGTTSVDGGERPLQFALGPVTPNPGSGARSLWFTIPSTGHVTLRVFDASGRSVATLYDRELERGRYSAQFSTDRWSVGTYFYRLETAGFVRSGRLVVLK